MTYVPNISKSEFDELESEIKKVFVAVINDTVKSKQELCDWLDGELEDDFGSKPSGGLMIGAGSLIDSKVVITTSAAIQDFTGAKIHPDDIRKGGWKSEEEAWTHLSAKIRDRCHESSTALSEKSVKTSVAET